MRKYLYIIAFTEKTLDGIKKGLQRKIPTGKNKIIKVNNLKSHSHLPKKLMVFASLEALILKAYFVLNIFKFLSWLFGYVEKTAWLDKQD